MAADVRLLLKEMVDRGASDLYLTVDSPPVIRIEGVNHTLDGEPLDADRGRGAGQLADDRAPARRLREKRWR